MKYLANFYNECIYVVKEQNGKHSFARIIFHLTCKLKHSMGNELGFYDFWTGKGVTRGRKAGAVTSWLYCNTMIGCCCFKQSVFLQGLLWAVYCLRHQGGIAIASIKKPKIQRPPKTKDQQINRKTEEALRYSCERFDDRILSRELRLNAFLIA